MDVKLAYLLKQQDRLFDEVMIRVKEAGVKIEELYQTHPLPKEFKSWWIDNRHRYLSEKENDQYNNSWRCFYRTSQNG